VPTQTEKGLAFRALHQRTGAFLIPNPWDAGTARLLAHLGFEALATTSAGFAFSLGRPDNSLGRDAVMAHLAIIADATSLPVSGDLENGFHDSPAGVAETITLAAAAGLVGGSIEDATTDPAHPIYAMHLAADRIRAASEAARALPFPFTLTARAENYLHGRPNLHDTIQRLQAYQEAGADVLFAPGLTTAEQITAVISSVDRPVNVLAGSLPPQLDHAALSNLGVKRISVGSALTRAALAAFLRAAREMASNGTFTFTADAVPYHELNRIFHP
jgi:2-methylisocitrate lyase-like PEP mutase family enzyme